jgi:hypothetical protein
MKTKRKDIIKFLSSKKINVVEVEYKAGDVNTIYMNGIPVGSSQGNTFELIIRGNDRRKK